MDARGSNDLGKRRERAVAFIVARLSSSRFARKHFRLIGGRSILEWVLHNLRQCQELDEVVLATVAEPENEDLRAFARAQGIRCFWYEGHVDHVTNRLRSAAEAMGAELCLLVSGDCPLTYAPAVDALLRALRDHPQIDWVEPGPDGQGRSPVVEGLIPARASAWQRADDLSDRPELKEHQFPILRLRPELFARLQCPLPAGAYGVHHRVSVDTHADLEFMNAAHDALRGQGRPFVLPEVLALLAEQPALLQINTHIHQRKLVEDVRRVLLVTDAGGAQERETFAQARRLALQVVERLSWPVVFCLDDEAACAEVETLGLRVVWGAWERDARASATRQRQPLSALATQYDVVVLFPAFDRPLPAHWRTGLPARFVLALTPAGPSGWAAEADLSVDPSADPETWLPRFAQLVRQ